MQPALMDWGVLVWRICSRYGGAYCVFYCAIFIYIFSSRPLQLCIQGGIVKSILDLYELRNRDLNYSAIYTTSATSTDTESPSQVPSLRGRKGWGDRSVNHLLAAIDQARLLDDYRCV